MGAQVTYHQEGGADRVFTVLAERENGTVDIGPEGGEPVVTSCEIVDLPAIGKATLIADNPEMAEESAPEEIPAENDKSTKKNSKR